ncbi:MAG: RAD55 family ATPase [Methanomassiliicoccales archaeon]
MVREKERCVTGIEGLDAITGGGLPKGGMVLVVGECGSGKSALLAEFLMRGASSGERGLLLSTTLRPDKAISSLPDLDFFDEMMIKDGRLLVMDLEQLAEIIPEGEGKQAEKIVKAIDGMVQKTGATRLGIDSFLPLQRELPEADQRHLLKALSGMAMDRGCTTVLAYDAREVEGYSSVVADGVIMLRTVERHGDMLRTLQVVKMAGTYHSRSRYVFELTPIGTLMTPMLRGV